MAFNQIVIEGRLGGDPEVRATNSGKNVANFNVAVTRRFDREKTDWFKCVAFAQKSDLVEKFLHKGSKVLVSGQYVSNPYKNKNGVTMPGWELVVDNIEFLDPKSDTDISENISNETSVDDDTFPFEDDDDAPF